MAKKNFRLTSFYLFLSLVLMGLILFFGFPIIIKLIVFLGNLRTGSPLPTEIEDRLPPTQPKFEPIPEATNSAQISLRGFTEPAAKVEIFLNEALAGQTTAEKDGYFFVGDIKLNPGLNEIFAIATDMAGNTSQNQEKIIVNFDQTPPNLEITQPADKSSFPKRQNKIEIKGKTEPEANVTINNHFAILDQEGKFNFTFSLNEGENKIQIMTTDLAGNQTQKEITLYLE